MLNVNHIERINYVNGPGARYVIWCQGCSLKCEGCWNKHTWTLEKNKLMQVEKIFEDILSIKLLDGVTFSGGEPFLQAELFLKLAKMLKLNTHLDIQIFTGFEIEELNTFHQKELLKYADTLVTGRFDQEKLNNNQKVHYLSEKNWEFNNSDIEIDIDRDGNLMLTGYPTDKFIDELKGDINERIYN